MLLCHDGVVCLKSQEKKTTKVNLHTVVQYLDCQAGHEFGQVCLHQKSDSDFAILHASGEYFLNKT